MRKLFITGMLILVMGNIHANAQDPISVIIKAAVVKVIRAVDLKIQRLQTKTIWLQNAQKAVENEMSRLKLSEISEWEERQRKLYADYFEELFMIKDALAGYSKIKEIISKQSGLVKEFKTAYNTFSNDKNFSAAELKYMYNVYSGILSESAKNIDQLTLVITAFSTQMDDAKRMEMIDRISENLDEQLTDLRRFNNQNKMLSVQRTLGKNDNDLLSRIYGLQ